jgi:hypothetical protein
MSFRSKTDVIETATVTAMLVSNDDERRCALRLEASAVAM